MSKPKQMSTGGDVVVGKGQDYIKDLIWLVDWYKIY
jgi:hypothetical protein